jgi:hypothetical protein
MAVRFTVAGPAATNGAGTVSRYFEVGDVAAFDPRAEAHLVDCGVAVFEAPAGADVAAGAADVTPADGPAETADMAPTEAAVAGPEAAAVAGPSEAAVAEPAKRKPGRPRKTPAA